MEGDNLQTKIRRALEGNERVFFHPNDELIAVWYGTHYVNVFNSRTWENVDSYTVSLGFKDVPLAEVENAVSARMAREGFDRTGRSQIDTNLVEA